MIETSGKKIMLKLFIGIVAAVLVILAVGYGYVSSKLGKVQHEERKSFVQSVVDGSVITQSRPKDKESTESGVMNIMLVGVDNDYLPGMNERGNADGLVLLSINKGTKQIIMTSIMRDISIRVPDEYSTKVTMVYHDFGMDTLLNTLEANFEIGIDNYVMVNYLNVIDIVDAMGGLELELTAGEIEGMQVKIENLNGLTGEPYGTDVLTAEDAGLNHLNGKQIAALLRIRNTNNDYGRTAKAREILTAMKDKALKMSIRELNALADVVMENIKTDMGTADMLGLILKAPGYMGYDFVSNRIPVEGSYYGDGSFIYIDYPANVQALRDVVYGNKK